MIDHDNGLFCDVTNRNPHSTAIEKCGQIFQQSNAVCAVLIGQQNLNMWKS